MGWGGVGWGERERVVGVWGVSGMGGRGGRERGMGV